MGRYYNRAAMAELLSRARGSKPQVEIGEAQLEPEVEIGEAEIEPDVQVRIGPTQYDDERDRPRRR